MVEYDQRQSIVSKYDTQTLGFVYDKVCIERESIMALNVGKASSNVIEKAEHSNRVWQGDSPTSLGCNMHC